MVPVSKMPVDHQAGSHPGCCMRTAEIDNNIFGERYARENSEVATSDLGVPGNT